MYQNRDNYHQNYRHGHWFSVMVPQNLTDTKVKIICFRPVIACQRCGDLKSISPIIFSICTAMNVNLIFENDDNRKLTLVNGPRRNSFLFSVSSPFLNKRHSASICMSKINLEKNFFTLEKQVLEVQFVTIFYSRCNQNVQRFDSNDNVGKNEFHSPILVTKSR